MVSRAPKTKRKESTKGSKPKSKPKSKSKDKRSLIRKAAYRCFSLEGYHNTTVDRICATLEISKGSFYWYFDGKQSVYVNILDSWAEQVETEMAAQFKNACRGSNPFKSLRLALDREVLRGRRIAPVWLEFLAHVVRVPEVREGLKDFHGRILKSIKEICDPILPPMFDEQDREAISTILLAGFLGLLCLELVDSDQVRFKDLVGRFMAMVRFFVPEAHFEGERLAPV